MCFCENHACMHWPPEHLGIDQIVQFQVELTSVLYSTFFRCSSESH